MSRRDGPDEELEDLGIEEPDPEEDQFAEDEGDANEQAAVAAWLDGLEAVDGLPPDEGDGFEEEGPSGGMAGFAGELVGEGDGSPVGDDEPAPEFAGGWDGLVGDDDAADPDGPEGGLPDGLGDEWFLDDGPAPDPDGGAEGPVEDSFDDIDEEGWDEIGEAEDQDGDELEAEQAMARFGIELAEDSGGRPPVARLAGALAGELVFLGPREGSARAVAVGGGAPVAAGDAVFVLGADGLLHAVRERLPACAGSVCLAGDAIVVGTDTAGAFRFDHPAAVPVAINGWSTLGLGPYRGPAVSTSLEVFAGRRAGAPLFGLTGEGQLFASRDLGEHWAGPVTDGPCLAATAEEDGGELAALVRGPEGLFLVRGRPGHLRARRVADPRIEGWLRAGPPRLVAAGASVAVMPADPGAPLLLSLDGGEPAALPAVTGATAVALDGEDPSWLAVAVVDPEGGRAEVRLSEDGGRSFCTALHLEPGDGGSPAVTALAADAGTSTRLFAVTARGLFRLTLRGRTRGH
jgi:hypothetical protein